MTLRTSLFVLAVPFALVACSGNNHDKTAPDAAGSSGSDSGSGSGSATIALTSDGNLGSRLVDANGKTLYFFVNDVAGAGTSTYSGSAWPVFDASTITVGSGLDASDFAEIGSGTSAQTTWKGRPLYYFANDTSASPTAGEGIAGRWFVARDYDLFFGAASTVTPQGGSAEAPFVTDGAGRTVYMYTKDTPGVNGGSPTSACTSGCLTHWPIWQAPTSLSGLALPSTMQPANLTSFTNASETQFVFMGWPLYYYASDTKPGQVAGAGVADWYAVNVSWDGTVTQ
jgi:predicted lipoprotein with Yx(FWY)xxD motif